MADPSAKQVQGVAAGTPLPAQITDASGTQQGTAAAPLYVSPGVDQGSPAFLQPNVQSLRLASGQPEPLMVAPWLYNGSQWFAASGNNAFTILASTAVSATGQTGDFSNPDATGLSIFVAISAISGAGATVVVKVQGKDPVSGNYVDLPGAATPGLTATGTYLLQIYPSFVTIANSQVQGVIPSTYRLVYTVTGTAPSITMSIGADRQR